MKTKIVRSVIECWNCGEPVRVSYNPNLPIFHDQQSYNECEACKSVQGMFYLVMEPDGPFFGVQENHEEVEKEIKRQHEEQLELPYEPSERSHGGSEGTTL